MDIHFNELCGNYNFQQEKIQSRSRPPPMTKSKELFLPCKRKKEWTKNVLDGNLFVIRDVLRKLNHVTLNYTGDSALNYSET